MRVILGEITIAEIDEALEYLRLKLQDKYGNRLTHREKELYIDSVNDLLDARNTLVQDN